ncbi:MAG: F0F1 ATP synthase subunit B [Tannerellaceae bacterium]|nr:F0F1 ATP synthase subunit B [Tannerellaceae bacterium]
MSLLVPDIGLLFWMTLSFGIVFFILAKYAFPVITGAIENRNNYILHSLEAAREAEERLAGINREAEQLLEKANREYNAIVAEAAEVKKQIIADARAQAGVEAQQVKARAQAEIDELRRRALGELRHQIVDISVKVAGKAIAEELNTNQKQQELIDRLLDEELKLADR